MGARVVVEVDAKHSEANTNTHLLSLERASQSDMVKQIPFLGYVVAWHVLLCGG